MFMNITNWLAWVINLDDIRGYILKQLQESERSRDYDMKSGGDAYYYIMKGIKKLDYAYEVVDDSDGLITLAVAKSKDSLMEFQKSR